MAIAFRSLTSTSYAARTNTTLTAPAGLANGDIMIAMLFIGISGTVPPTVPIASDVPVGFTELTGGSGVTDGATFAGRLRIYWKRASAESGSYTFIHASHTTQAAMLAYSGVGAGGAVVDVSSFNSATSGTTTTATGVTTTAANDMLVFLAHEWSGTATETPPSGMTERFDGLIYAADALQASAGASGNKTQTLGSSQPWSAWLVAIRETPPTPGLRSSSSTSYAARTNTVINAPPVLVNGDIMICGLFVGVSGTPSAPVAPAGWTELPTSPRTAGASGFNLRFHAYWKRAASEGASYTFTHAAYSSQGVILAYGNSLASGNPVDVSSINGGTGNAAVGTGVTARANDTLIWLSHDFEGLGTLAPPSGMMERFDGLVYAADQSLGAAGATGNKTQTNNNTGAGVWSAYMIALMDSATIVGKPVKVWSGSAWVTRPVKVWSGSAWVTKPAKIWNGSDWL